MFCCFGVLFHEFHCSAGHPGLVISIYGIFLDRNLPINRTSPSRCLVDEFGECKHLMDTDVFV